MNGLILKDLINIRTTCIYMVIISVVFSVIFENSSIIIPAMILSCMVGTSFTYDRMADWDAYAVSIGVDRRTMVRSKFALAMILLALGTIIGVIVTIASNAAKDNSIDLYMISDNVLFAIGASLITCGISCTISYATSPEKAVSMTGMMSSLCVIVAITISTLIGYNELSVPELIPLIVLAFGVVTMSAGYILSCRLFLKKDL